MKIKGAIANNPQNYLNFMNGELLTEIKYE
jgi:hypothetical protein